MKAIVIGAAASLLSTAALAGPSMAANWRPTALALEECKQRAEKVVRGVVGKRVTYQSTNREGAPAAH